MLKKLAPIIIFNVLIGLVFVFSNIYIWGILNSQPESWTQLRVSPFVITISHMYIPDNGPINLGPLPTQILNYPFFVFWIALVGNICFAILALKSKEKKPNPN